MQLSKISKDQALKIVKATVYVGLSAAISYVITLIANDPALFGPLTPIVNIILVFLKQLFTKPE